MSCRRVGNLPISMSKPAKRELEDIPSVEALPRYGDDEGNAQIADGREAAE
jgi:hypothetical protein